LKKEKADERKQQFKKEKGENIIKNVDDLSKVERKLEVIDDDEDGSDSLKVQGDQESTEKKDAEENHEKEEDLPEINKERAKYPDPINNGGVTDQYSWTQTLKDFSLIINIEDDIKSKQIKID